MQNTFSEQVSSVFEADRPGLPCTQPLEVVTLKFRRNYMHFTARAVCLKVFTIFS